jgi:hypothetical protein
VFTVQDDGSVLPVARFSDRNAPIAVNLPNNVAGALCVDAAGGRLEVHLQGTGALVRLSAP